MKIHPRLISLVLLILICIFGSSCQSLNSGKSLTTLGAVGAGTLAWKMTEGKSTGERLAWTAASAAGAYALGEHVRSKIIESEQNHYKQGYQQGMADAVKRQYEIIQNRQQTSSQSERSKFVLYEFPGVTHRNGVNFAPHTVKLRVLEE